ncbi:MAG: hypothetical protein ABIH39_01850 [Candidatus Margulisiibacteriota bacterium]
MSHHPAKILKQSSPEWERFFAEKYRGIKSLFAALPDLPRPGNIELLQYYLHFHPEKRNRKSWYTIFKAIELAISEEKWSKFFNHEYSNPHDMIKEIPPSFKYSELDIARYYVLLQLKDVRNNRVWAGCINAMSLKDSSAEWYDFFSKEFNSPLELLSAIPKSATQSKSTIASYYMVLHPVKTVNEYRRWINAVAAISLAETSAQWHDFFFTAYNNPKEMLEAVPASSDRSPVTITGYYLALHPAIDKPKLWSNTAAALVFLKNNREAVEAVRNKQLNYAGVKKKFRLKVTKNTFDTYIYLLNMFDYV